MRAVRITHIYREGNSGADLMANHGCAVGVYNLWESNFPVELLELTE